MQPKSSKQYLKTSEMLVSNWWCSKANDVIFQSCCEDQCSSALNLVLKPLGTSGSAIWNQIAERLRAKLKVEQATGKGQISGETVAEIPKESSQFWQAALPEGWDLLTRQLSEWLPQSPYN